MKVPFNNYFETENKRDCQNRHGSHQKYLKIDQLIHKSHVKKSDEENTNKGDNDDGRDKGNDRCTFDEMNFFTWKSKIMLQIFHHILFHTSPVRKLSWEHMPSS